MMDSNLKKKSSALEELNDAIEYLKDTRFPNDHSDKYNIHIELLVRWERGLNSTSAYLEFAEMKYVDNWISLQGDSIFEVCCFSLVETRIREIQYDDNAVVADQQYELMKKIPTFTNRRTIRLGEGLYVGYIEWREKMAGKK